MADRQDQTVHQMYGWVSKYADARPSALERSIKIMCSACAAIATLLVLIAVVAIGYGVFMRYALGTPITWVDELSGYLVVAIVMFGAAEALIKGDHIQVDLLTTSLKGHSLKAMRFVWMALVVALMLALLLSAWQTVSFSRDFGLYSEGYLQVPMWLPQSLLIVGSVHVVLAALAKICSAIDLTR